MWIVAASASLVLLALWATWPEENMRWIAYMLATSMAMSLGVHFLGHIQDVPGVYTMAEIFVITATYVAWAHHRQFWQIALAAVSAVSIAANIALATKLHPVRTQINAHEAITNICFAIECLIAIGMGAAHGVRTGRFHWRPGFRHVASQSHGVRNRDQ